MSATEQPVDPKNKIPCCRCSVPMQHGEVGIMDRADKLRICVPCIRTASRAVKDKKICGIKVIDFSLYLMLSNHRG